MRRAAGAQSFYKSGPRSDDETLSPPSFALCAEGTLKSQETGTRGAGGSQGSPVWGWEQWWGDSALPPVGTTSSPLLRSHPRLQDKAPAAQPSRRKRDLEGQEEGEAPFSKPRFGSQVVGEGEIRWPDRETPPWGKGLQRKILLLLFSHGNTSICETS